MARTGLSQGDARRWPRRSPRQRVREVEPRATDARRPATHVGELLLAHSEARHDCDDSGGDESHVREHN